MRIPILLFAALAPASQLFAQLQLGNLDSLAAKAKESVVITLDPATLRMASGLLDGGKGKDGKAAQVLSGVKSITVRSFEFDQEGQYDPDMLRPIRDQLRSPGWSKIIEVKERRESTEIYMKSEQGNSAGFAILAAEPKELTVIYIVGTFDLANLATVGDQFGIRNLGVPNKGKLK
jgi:hypothetical protein